MAIEGRVWRFADDINTDLIIAGKYLENYDPSYLASHAMEGANKEFAAAVRPGDIIIAGSNFGSGSSREQAVIALKHCGVSAVVARSFARIFYRNAVNLGLLVAVSRDAVDVFPEGAVVGIDLDHNRVVAAGGGKEASLDPLPTHVKRILDEGGLVPFIKKQLRERELTDRDGPCSLTD